MANTRKNIKVRISTYKTPRNKWRHKVHSSVWKALRNRKIKYQPTDKLELHIRC